MLKYIIILSISFLLNSCGYVYEDQLVYRSQTGLPIAEIKVETLNFSLRVQGTDYTNSTLGLFKNIKVTEPYTLNFNVRDFENVREKLFIHSLIIKDSTSVEVLKIIPEKDKSFTLPFRKAKNGSVISWNAHHYFKDSSFKPKFINGQSINIEMDISIVSGKSVLRKQLLFKFKAVVEQHSGFIPVWNF